MCWIYLLHRCHRNLREGQLGGKFCQGHESYGQQIMVMRNYDTKGALPKFPSGYSPNLLIADYYLNVVIG